MKRDLVLSEEVVHYQKVELKRHKEKFERERSCWMHQLEECKRKIVITLILKRGKDN